jgi:hypothetical protein
VQRNIKENAMLHQYFQPKNTNPFTNSLERPIKEIMDLNIRTLQSFSYFTPTELLKLRKPEEVMEKNLEIMIENSQAAVTYMQNMFGLMEKHLLKNLDSTLKGTQDFSPLTKRTTTTTTQSKPSTKKTASATKTTATKSKTVAVKSARPATKTSATKSKTVAAKSARPATTTLATKSKTVAAKSARPATKTLATKNKTVASKFTHPITNTTSLKKQPVKHATASANKSALKSTTANKATTITAGTKTASTSTPQRLTTATSSAAPMKPMMKELQTQITNNNLLK